MAINEFVKRLLEHLGISSESVNIVNEENLTIVSITVKDDDSGLLIGYHGESLGALQKILQSIFRKNQDDNKIIVNVNDYKERREAQLKEMTMKIAERVKTTGQSYVFPFLPANERLVVHQVVAELTQQDDFSGIVSLSSGEGRDRRLEIRIKE